MGNRKQGLFELLPSGAAAVFRDQLSLTTWLALGAIIQSILFAAIGRWAFLPALTLVAYRFLDSYLQASGLKRNDYMEAVMQTKFSAQIPDSEGRFGSKPADSEVVVFLLGARINQYNVLGPRHTRHLLIVETNSPFGALAPGGSELDGYFTKMMSDLQDRSEEYGLLGSSSWLSAGERSTKNEIMQLMYFRTTEGLHQFARKSFLLEYNGAATKLNEYR